MSTPAHVIFDLDGTLVDSAPDLATAVNRMRADFGLVPLELAVVRGYVGDGARVLVERTLGPEHADLRESGLGSFLRHYGEHLIDETRPYPGIVQLLAALAAAGLTASVLTNKPEALSRRLLEGLGLDRAFLAIVGGDTLTVKKPQPDGVRVLMKRAGTEASRTLLVGDSLVDLATARASGVAFCGVAWGFDPDRLVGANVPIVTSPAVLGAALVERW